MTLLRRLGPEEVRPVRCGQLPAAAIAVADELVQAVEVGGESALRATAERLGDVPPGGSLVRSAEECRAALARVPAEVRDVLGRTAERIRRFASAQRAALEPLDVDVPGGRAGHEIVPVDVAGCYAPGGRHPLPSSVLMTAITARTAGVGTVVLATPRPVDVTLAAAAIAGVDHVLAVGGAHGIAALAFGVVVPACDVIVGPGNAFVAAAKQRLAGRVRIDMVAGPSELLVLADDSARPDWIAADLLAQAEHDDDAVPMLVTTSAALLDRVEAELAAQLATLPTARTARRALQNGFVVLAKHVDELVELADRVAAEHVQVMLREPERVRRRLRHHGAVFVGAHSAEVFGDYGFGPNHVLPTGGAARAHGGLSVFDFLRVRTWLALDGDRGDAAALARADAVALAELEGLAGHARAARVRADDAGDQRSG